MKAINAIAAILVALGCAPAAHAALLTFDLGCSFDCGDVTGQQQLSFVSDDRSIKATPFFSQRNDGSGRLRTSTPDGTRHATLTSWSTGLGLENPINANEYNFLNSAIDNRGRKDFVLFEFDDVYTLASFELGWQRAAANAADSTAFADLQFWMGGPTAAGFNLNNKCVFGCNNSANDLMNLGFTALPDFDDVPYGEVFFGDSLQTRYLLISGNLASNDDFFELRRLTLATIPVPGTGSLLGAALLGMLGSLRLRTAKRS